MDRTVFSLLVDNTSGVLGRIAGMFSRRGYNIDSLTVGVTADPKYSRMTVVVTASADIVEQIENQLRKQEDVREIKKLMHGDSVCRELLMIKIRARAQDRQDIVSTADIFRAKIVDVADDSLIIELTGNQDKLEAFIHLLSDYEILELARTGLTGLTRGSNDVTYLE